MQVDKFECLFDDVMQLDLPARQKKKKHLAFTCRLAEKALGINVL